MITIWPNRLGIVPPLVGPTLPFLKAAKSRILAGTGRGTGLVIGDSTTFGEHGGNAAGGDGGYNVGCTANAWPMVMAAYFAAHGLPVNMNGRMGDGGCNQYGQYVEDYSDQVQPVNRNQWFRVPYMSGDRSSLGGSPLIHQKQNPAGIGDTNSYFSFNPAGILPGAGLTNRLRLFYHAENPYGFSVVEGGGIPQIIYTSADNDKLKYFDFAAPTRAAQSYYFNPDPTTAGIYVIVQGGYAYDTATPALDIINAGVRGSGLNNWLDATTNHAYFKALALLAPDISFIMPPINDLLSGMTPEDLMAKLILLITECKKTGDVVLINAAAIKVDGGRPAQAVRDALTTKMAAVASNFNLVFVDLEAALGTYANNIGEYFDDLHPFKVRLNKMGTKVGADTISVLANS